MNVNPLGSSSYRAPYVSERVIPEFIRGVYMWMAVGLALTGLVAYGVASSPALVGT